MSIPETVETGPGMLLYIAENWTKWSITRAEVLFPEINKFLRAKYPNRHSLGRAFTRVHNLMKPNNEIWKLSKKLIAMTKAEQIDNRQNAEARLAKMNNDKITVDKAKIFNVIDKTKSGNLYEQILCCMLATGARKIEILNPAVSLFAVDLDNPIAIVQIGVAKDKRLREGITEKKRLVIKPCLHINRDTVISLINIIRAEIKTAGRLKGTNEAIGNRFSRPLNKYIRKYFPETATMHNKTHYLRRIYANLSWEMYGKQTKMTLNAWINAVLGHEGDGLQASLHYTNVKISAASDEIKHVDPDLLNKIDEIDAEIKDIALNVDEVINEITASKILKQTNLRNTPKADKLRRIHEQVESQFLSNGIAVNVRNVRKIGVSTALASEYVKARKQTSGNKNIAELMGNEPITIANVKRIARVSTAVASAFVKKHKDEIEKQKRWKSIAAALEADK